MNEPESLQERSWWYTYDKKPVFVQLREPYVGVTYPNMPIVTSRATESGKVEGVVYVPFVRGFLHVKPEGKSDGSVLLVVETSDPNPNGEGGTVYIVLHPEDVLYMTHVEQNSLIRA